jgi:hypothetical protein
VLDDVLRIAVEHGMSDRQSSLFRLPSASCVECSACGLHEDNRGHYGRRLRDRRCQPGANMRNDNVCLNVC